MKFIFFIAILLVGLKINAIKCQMVKDFEERLQCYIKIDEKIAQCKKNSSMKQRVSCLKKFKKISDFEEIKGLKINLYDQYLEFKTTTGCDTEKNFIILKSNNSKSHKTNLKVYRISGSFCEVAHLESNIKYSYKDLGISSKDEIDLNEK